MIADGGRELYRQAKIKLRTAQIQKEREEAIKIEHKHNRAIAIKLYELEKGFKNSETAKEYLDLQRENVNFKIAQLIRTPTTDPNIARLQGEILAVHNLLEEPIDPREGQKIESGDD